MNSNTLLIQLQTFKGEAVADVPILPFRMFPDVVAWGARVFKLYAVNEFNEAAARLGAPQAVYREAEFFYAIPIQG